MSSKDPDEAEVQGPVPLWRRALKVVEWAVTAALLVFVAIRLGPQLGALTGISFAPEPAPAYAFVSLGGDTIRSGDLAGQVVVLNFWATWCGPCKLEMPSLQKLHERRAGDGVVVLGLSTDAGREAGIRAFLEERQITYPVGRANQAHRRAFGGIPGIPTTFIIDRSGTVRHRVVGYFAPPAMNAAVSRLLDETGP
ncbi:MAG: TlpA disulfide reductase family protein [Gemmatimonadota bacterium]